MELPLIKHVYAIKVHQQTRKYLLQKRNRQTNKLYKKNTKFLFVKNKRL
jgi:hypothetical protein